MSDVEGYSAIAESTEKTAADGSREAWLRRWRWPLILGGPLLIALVVWIVIANGGKAVSTDNAYVQIAKAPVAASIGGRVIAVYVHENERVKAGQVLFRIDSRDASAAEAQAAADVANAQQAVGSLRAVYLQAQTKVAAARVNLDFIQKDAVRVKALVAAGVNSDQDLDTANRKVREAAYTLISAQREADVALANLGGDRGSQPQVQAALARLQRTRIAVSNTEVVALTDGVVTRVDQLPVGSYVNPAQTVFWLITGQPWVEANFKENQLARMRVGQPVTIKLDADPGLRLKGRVASFSPGTGAVFSALPAQNATGNWVKVTQRLPVRIVFDQPPPDIATRAGLSASVTVDVRSPNSRASGPRGK
ncbi:membrane fusion protein (multidrug efflux system) [Caulobacter ginsengisoli]|uniref:Membrane fusion protein (Multidrug efflux system) n=1 Tax=Caulobacter ginsengisoli TaxID=400775 RepID=A0ABU0IV58_9CAUL|nr:HlyD family secretion protein [Caulobacter ginsengisoli]MDQ0465890.1 membrane fusion protein (multidrug efflux system) [Caulobacter ginsengisoli]